MNKILVCFQGDKGYIYIPYGYMCNPQYCQDLHTVQAVSSGADSHNEPKECCCQIYEDAVPSIQKNIDNSFFNDQDFWNKRVSSGNKSVEQCNRQALLLEHREVLPMRAQVIRRYQENKSINIVNYLKRCYSFCSICRVFIFCLSLLGILVLIVVYLLIYEYLNIRSQRE